MSLEELGEFGFIDRVARKLQTRRGTKLGIGDDAAILDSLQTPIVTCDALIENVHFRWDWTPRFVLGRKAMNVSVSDLAAKGARPVAAFVTLGISEKLRREPNAMKRLENLYAGFEDAAHEWDFTIAGGDTTRTQNEIVISVTLIGEAGSNAPILRSGARAGDIVFVTGTLGDAAAGLWDMQTPEIKVSKEAHNFLLARHLNPTPRLRETQAVLGSTPAGSTSAGSTSAGSTPIINAALDLSDGLAGDAAHIARASNVQIEIETAALPISPACREAAEKSGIENAAQDWALYGGEDYELLWCVSPQNAALLSQALARFGSTPITAIGRCVAQNENDAASVVLVFPDGRRQTPRAAWTHF